MSKVDENGQVVIGQLQYVGGASRGWRCVELVRTGGTDPSAERFVVRLAFQRLQHPEHVQRQLRTLYL